MPRVSKWSLLTIVTHGQIVLLTLSVQVVSSSRRVDRGNSLAGRRLRSERLVAMRNGTSDDLLHGRIRGVIHKIGRNIRRMWESCARIDAKHLLLSTNDGSFVLPVGRLAQVMLERSAAQV